jgi:hypothetical protein
MINRRPRPVAGGRRPIPAQRFSALERQLLVSARDGAELVVNGNVPSDVIRGHVVRDALAGVFAPLHQRGLRARGLRIDGDLDLSHLRWEGELSLIECHISGGMILDYARPVGKICMDRSHVQSLSATGAVIEGSLLLRDGFTVDDGIYALGIRVSDSFNMRRARIVGPVAKPTRQAVELFRANLGDLFLTHAQVDGGVYAAGMSVARNARFHGATIRSRASLGWEDKSEFRGALTIAGSEIKGSLYLCTATTRDTTRHVGLVRLNSMACRGLFFYQGSLDDTELELDGLRYLRLGGVSPEQFLSILERGKKFHPQPYVQLANYCDVIGQVTIKRRVLVALERRLTHQLPRWSPGRLLRQLHGAFVGYGYRASLAFPWLLLTIVLSVLLLRWHGGFFIEKPLAGGALQTFHDNVLPWSDAIGVTFDNLLPFASLGIKDQWVGYPQSAAEWSWLVLFLVLKFGAWGLVALALASITGVIRKSR